MRKYLFILSLFFYTAGVMAQKTEKVDVNYTYYAGSHESVDEAKINAWEEGKVQAIADAFGTIISSMTSSIISSGGSGKSDEDFLQLGSSDVKGEWIETLKEPEYDIQYKNGTLLIKVTGEGLAREIISAKVDFKAKILRNGTEDKFESTNFRNNDYLYLSFISPVDGYLAVYFIDSKKDASCLLPYQAQTDGIYHIDANRRYVLFSEKTASPAERHLVDEYVLTTEYPVEQDQIYLIFSTHEFTKALDNDSGTNSAGLHLPRQLKLKDFQKWLSKCRKRDNNMCLEKTIISISGD